LNIEDEGYFANTMDCPECHNSVVNATTMEPWIMTSYLPGAAFGSARIYQREYIDEASCTKCIITFSMTGSLATTISAVSNPCQTIILPDCLQNQPLKMFINGHPEGTMDFAGGTAITLCCNNSYGIENPTYILYSETDPCCYMIVTLDCGEVGRMHQVGLGEESLPNHDSGWNLKIIPNPATSSFRIVSEGGVKSYKKVEVLDLNGQAILSYENINSDAEINIISLPKSTYFVKVTTAGGMLTTLKLVTATDN
jgi:hypothetical protein